MKYISEIYLDGRRVDRVVWKHDCGLFVKIADTESDEVWFCEDVYSKDILGVHHFLQSTILISYSKQAILFGDHIASTSYEVSFPKIGKDSQVCVWNWHEKMPSNIESLRHKELLVDCKDSCIHLYGYRDSVIDFAVVHSMHFNLYDFILFMNRFTGLQLQSWGRVVFCSRSIGFCYAIEFKHGAEDDRFFAKMSVLQG